MWRSVSACNRKCVALLAVWLLAGSSARAEEMVYRKAVLSTVLIVTPNSHIGSGVLVDVERGLVVTADHVLGKSDTVAAVFPEFDRAGRPITEKAHYAKSGGAIGGKVLARRATCDLALIQLESIPTSARAITLSADGAREGQAVHVIGHSNIGNGAVFGCVSGQVRNVYTNKPSAKIPLAGRVVLTSVATNKGDSGGPVINDDGELVAIVSGGTSGGPADRQQVVDHSVDVSEVRTLLDAHRPSPAVLAMQNARDGSRPGFNPYELQPAERLAITMALEMAQPSRPGDRAHPLFPPLPRQSALVPADRH